MSRELLPGHIQTAVGKVRSALAAQSLPYTEAIEAASTKVASCRRTADEANSRVIQAATALRGVKAAKKTASSPAVGQAAAAAQTELTAAEAAQAQARQELAAAENELATASEPIKDLSEALRLLGYVGSYEGSSHARVSTVQSVMSTALAVAKAPHPAIALAESKVVSRTAALTVAQQTERNAETANTHMQQAARDSKVQAIVDGAAATARELVTAQSAKAQAQADLESAEAELRTALQPIAQVVAAHEWLFELAKTAERADGQHHQQVRDAEQARENAQQAERDADPCTCSETNCPCSYCRSEQQAWATGQRGRDDDMTR